MIAVGDGQVEVAVAGEVPRHDGDRVRPDRVGDLGLERAVAVAQQHRDRRRDRSVGDGQVEVAVAVEVPRHDRDRARPHRVGDLGLERAVAVAQQDGDVVGAAVGDGQVEVGRRR